MDEPETFIGCIDHDDNDDDDDDVDDDIDGDDKGDEGDTENRLSVWTLLKKSSTNKIPSRTSSSL